MRNIDFFSQSPNIFIFHKESNQTTFGGILFLIYLLIMIIISLIYILDYALNNKYIVENISYINSTRKQSDNPFAYWDIYDEKILDYNPVLNVSFNLFKVNESNPANISDKFVVVDAYHFLPLERKTVFQTNISSLGFIIVYLCDDEECSLDDDDHNALGYMFELKYSGFQLDHQGDIPLIKDDSTFFVNFYCFSFTSTVLTLLNWEIVRYEESKGMLGIFDKWSEEEAGYTGGYISLKGNTFLTHPIIRTNIIQGKRVKLLAEFLLTNVLNTEYRRKKISFLDVLANIGALFITIYSVFLFIFNYYSKNFNNYQIIKSIMNKKSVKLSQYVKPKPNEKLIRMEKELDDINNNNNDDEKKLHLITNYDNKLSINNEENSDIELENTEELRKFSFFQFFMNNIYNKSCCKLNEQEIIGLINEITVNYLSIDLILYNQIMIENILKDYHWNDAKLKDINNNEDIIKLRNLLKKPV